jgi:hypothetical protein
LLISLLWEVTLALPYGWWSFQHRQMIGLFIGAWDDLPIEEVCVWIAVPYATAIVFEIVKLWQASGRTMKEALLGSGVAPGPRAVIGTHPESPRRCPANHSSYSGLDSLGR